MNKYQLISIKDREFMNNKLIEMFIAKEIETNGFHQFNINTWSKVLTNTNTYNIAGISNRAENINVVINVAYCKELSLPNNSYVTHLPKNVLTIVFDDDMIGLHGSKISLSPFYSCILLKP